MSKINQLRGECLRKKRYRTEGRAKKVKKWSEAEHGVKLRVYYCPHCFGYHLTKEENWKAA